MLQCWLSLTRSLSLSFTTKTLFQVYILNLVTLGIHPFILAYIFQVARSIPHHYILAVRRSTNMFFSICRENMTWILLILISLTQIITPTFANLSSSLDCNYVSPDSQPNSDPYLKPAQTK